MFRRRKYFNIIRFDDEGMKDVGLGKDGWSKQGSISFSNNTAIQDPYISTRFKSCYCAIIIFIINKIFIDMIGLMKNITLFLR